MTTTHNTQPYHVDRPALRPVEPRWILHQNEERLWLRDPLALSDRVVLVPAAAAPIIGLLNGERTAAGIESAFQLLCGNRLPKGFVENFLTVLNDAGLLFGPTYDAIYQQNLAEYRSASYRQPALAGSGYPADPETLQRLLADYASDVPLKVAMSTSKQLRGLITPHIDYMRGGATYARAWLPARKAVADAELVIIFGTDHAGAPGSLTLTGQQYATPWGSFPKDHRIVEQLVEALGEGPAFAQELHHRSEHSIELAAVWLHWLLLDVGRQDDLPSVVPILCGSFAPFTDGDGDPLTDPVRLRAITSLRKFIAERRTLVVAAADLAHVGPVFGDRTGWDDTARAKLKESDERMLAVASDGNPADFLAALRVEKDAHRVCGLPPIYWALQTLDGVRGELLGYNQCPADAQGSSWVSIAGMAYT